MIRLRSMLSGSAEFADARNAQGEFLIGRNVTEFFRTQEILEHKSAASKQTANPRGPIAGAFSELAD